MSEYNRVAIIGMGAIGASYSDQIVRNAPQIVLSCVVRDPERYQKVPLSINGRELVLPYRSDAELNGIPQNLIILAVKSYHLDEVIARMGGMVGEETVILSFLNGITSEEKLLAAFGADQVLYSTVVDADVNRNENRISMGSLGRVILGERSGETSPRVEQLRSFFDMCGISCTVSPHILRDLWVKMMINAGCNQTSTVYQLTYGGLRKSPEAIETMRAAQREIIALANRQGVGLGEADIEQWEQSLARLSPDGRSSMLQDYWMKRPLETDILGDYICALGERFGVPVPTNTRLRDRIHELQREADSSGTPSEVSAVPCASTRKKKGNLNTPEKIANQLRIDIITGKLMQGEKLAENQLAQQFSASRSSVRTALQILSNEGLILTHPNGRREAVKFSEQQVKELYDFRWLIEQHALKLILERRVSHNSIFPQLVLILGRIEHSCTSSTPDIDWYDLDVSFHRALVRSADNLFLTNAWESNAQIIYALMNFNTLAGYGTRYAAEFFEKHRKIYELMLSGDEACFQELKKHILDAEEISSSVMQICNKSTF